MAANLIENAVRHNSPDGWIEIRTRPAGDEAQLEISNPGQPITPEDAASLTQPFRRLGSARTGDGVGLGLSIATAIAHAQGGHLAIAPLEQGGLRVSIALPAAPLTPERPDGESEPSRATRGRDHVESA